MFPAKSGRKRGLPSAVIAGDGGGPTRSVGLGFRCAKLRDDGGGVAGVSPAEGVAKNAAGGWSEGEASPFVCGKGKGRWLGAAGKLLAKSERLGYNVL
jgi:hypothetical protein